VKVYRLFSESYFMVNATQTTLTRLTCIVFRNLSYDWNNNGRFTHSMPCPCRAAKGLECVFPI
jgi:hypothetical protein